MSIQDGITIVYAVIAILIWWAYSGYIFVLYFLGKRSSNSREKTEKIDVFVSIIVPVFNEEEAIGNKLENLMKLSYPSELVEVLIADGGSTDRTAEIVSGYADSFSRIKLLGSDTRSGKVHDLNKGLAAAKGDIIVISDADCLVDENGLEVLAVELKKEGVGAAGVCTVPNSENCPPEEVEYWVVNNKLKFLESSAGSAHCLIASFYGFWKKYLSRFPDNVIADDLYTALRIVQIGNKAVYTPSAMAVEQRVPTSLKSMFYHKHRKAHGYFREFHRFGFSLLGKSPNLSLIYFSKLIQFFLAPVLSLAFILLSILLVLYGEYLVALLSWLLLLASISISSKVLNGIGHPQFNIPQKSAGKVKALVLSNLVLISALLTYPFIKKTSRYTRIR